MPQRTMFLLESTDRICFSFPSDDDDEVIVCHAVTDDLEPVVEDLAGMTPRIAPPRPGRYVPAPFCAETDLHGWRGK